MVREHCLPQLEQPDKNQATQAFLPGLTSWEPQVGPPWLVLRSEELIQSTRDGKSHPPSPTLLEASRENTLGSLGTIRGFPSSGMPPQSRDWGGRGSTSPGHIPQTATLTWLPRHPSSTRWESSAFKAKPKKLKDCFPSPI